MRGFLGTESYLIAQAIERFPHAVELLRGLRQQLPDEAVTRKLDEIIAALRDNDSQAASSGR